MKILTTVFLSLLTLSAQACPVEIEEFEQMQLNSSSEVTDKALFRDGINYFEFMSVANKIRDYYTPLLKKAGKKLEVKADWFSSRENASSSQSKDTWYVLLSGGFARLKYMTADAYLMVACHEMGHHLGGFPQYPKDTPLKWASAEGQSDYYAALKCFKNIRRGELETFKADFLDVPDFARKSCRLQHKTNSEYRLCLRGVRAAADFGSMLLYRRTKKARDPMAHFVNSTEVVEETNSGYSDSVCRAETARRGSLCNVSSLTAISKSNEQVGVCHSRNGQQVGARPECWFKAKL